jgi:hypothetical protein
MECEQCGEEADFSSSEFAEIFNLVQYDWDCGGSKVKCVKRCKDRIKITFSSRSLHDFLTLLK